MIDIFATMKTGKYKNIIFDLDGTLTDSQMGIKNSLIYSFKNMGIKYPGEDEITAMIGVPLQEVYNKYFHLQGDEIKKAVFFFRKYYGEKGVYENEVYPGIQDLLSELSKFSKLYIATSKLEKYANLVLDHFRLIEYFSGVSGADEDGHKAGKTYLVNKVVNDHNLERDSNSVMVGDKAMDIIAARECGIQSIGLTYGYGSKEEITETCPDFIAENIPQLRNFLV